MSLFPPLSPRLLAASALSAALAAGGGCLAYLTVRQHIRAADKLTVTTHLGYVPASFSECHAVREVVNHAGHKLTRDSRSVELAVPLRGSGLSGLSDEEILARFVQTFFGGVVLAPERAALRALRVQMTSFSKVPCTAFIWSKAELSEKRLPPLNSILFGSFQVLDTHIVDSSARATTTTTKHADSHSDAHDDKANTDQESYIDIGFGNDRTQFAGVHRFCVSRRGRISPPSSLSPSSERDGSPSAVTEKGPDDCETVVVLYHHGVTCNPTHDRTRDMEDSWLFKFHMLYADLLFRESVARLQTEIGRAC
ncbi:hypothetical protein Micbo1qcDRAFT_167769 [Microdochium bolleyi]|uniref:Uncharacterized protein n=1 Tax=Microdochium bolleyi TaxID=196109 RepID=A0A136IQ20_9PEZI|nr:hypothetical protein Micbo1qcDRAFT_167769 [Microdochium bolleyi]